MSMKTEEIKGAKVGSAMRKKGNKSEKRNKDDRSNQTGRGLCGHRGYPPIHSLGMDDCFERSSDDSNRMSSFSFHGNV
jgi:hypothetical protein